MCLKIKVLDTLFVNLTPFTNHLKFALSAKQVALVFVGFWPKTEVLLNDTSLPTQATSGPIKEFWVIVTTLAVVETGVPIFPQNGLDN